MIRGGGWDFTPETNITFRRNFKTIFIKEHTYKLGICEYLMQTFVQIPTNITPEFVLHMHAQYAIF
jgi:hypothetical protein